MPKYPEYPKTKSIAMKQVKPEVFGKPKQETTAKGPHLLQGKGNPYFQMKVGGGFIVQDTRPGHTQAANMTGKKSK